LFDVVLIPALDGCAANFVCERQFALANATIMGLKDL
jgi:hypothetical protein